MAYKAGKTTEHTTQSHVVFHLQEFITAHKTSRQDDTGNSHNVLKFQVIKICQYT